MNLIILGVVWINYALHMNKPVTINNMDVNISDLRYILTNSNLT